MTSPDSPRSDIPVPPPRPPSGWQSFTAGTMSVFRDYANWLVSISWKRFFVLAVLLLIAAVILQHLPPFNYTVGSVADVGHSVTLPPPPVPPVPPMAGSDSKPAIKIEKKDSKGRDVVISIDRDGVRIRPNLQIDRNGVRIGPAAAASAASDAAVAASAAASAASAAARAGSASVSIADDGIEIKLPPGADSEEVREAVEEARQAVIEAIRESQEKSSGNQFCALAGSRVTKPLAFAEGQTPASGEPMNP